MGEGKKKSGFLQGFVFECKRCLDGIGVARRVIFARVRFAVSRFARFARSFLLRRKPVKPLFIFQLSEDVVEARKQQKFLDELSFDGRPLGLSDSVEVFYLSDGHYYKLGEVVRSSVGEVVGVK